MLQHFLYYMKEDITMSLRTTGCVLVVFLCSVTVVLGQDGWGVTYSTQSICAGMGSSLELNATYTHPSNHKFSKAFWYMKNDANGNLLNLMDDPDYRDRVMYRNDKRNTHTLTITGLRASDSAMYWFRLITDQPGGKYTGNPGVTLSVTGLQVNVAGENTGKTLTCSTTCPLPGNTTYIWYKNGQIVNESTSPKYKDSVYSNNEDSYSCAVKGQEDFHSPAMCVQGQDCSRVIYTEKSICVLKATSVDISCTYDGYYSVTSSLWFSPKQSGRWRDKLIPEDLTTDPGYAGRVEYSDQESRRYRGPFTLRITDVREEDSAEYRFTFKTHNNFTWGQNLPGTTLTVTALQVEVTDESEGQNVMLNCITTCTLPGNPFYIWYKNGEHIDESTSPQHKDSVYRNYGDSYSCAVKGHEDLYSPVVCVQGQDCSRVIYTKRRICVLKGSSVDISCTYVGYSNVRSSLWFSPKQNGRWRDKLTPEDLTTDPGYAGRVEYPDQESRRYRGPFTLRITDVREEDSAEYRFTFKTENNFEWGQSFHGTTLTVTGLKVEVSPTFRSESKTLTCSSTCPLPGNTTYIWYKNGQHIDESTSPQYKDSVYSNYGDSYSCAVKGHEDLHSPAVCLYGQGCSRVIYTERRICVLKGSSVDISCTYAGYYYVTSSLWFSPKQNGRWRNKLIPEDLTTDPGYAGRVESSDQSSWKYGRTSTLTINDVREEDSAEYRFTFKTEHNFTWGQSLPGTTLTLTALQVEVMHESEGQNVTLTCSTTCPLPGNTTYIWYKNGQHINESTSPQYKDSVYSNYEDSYSCAVKGHEDLYSPAVCVQGQDCSRLTYTKRRTCVLKGSSVNISCTYVGYSAVTSSLWFSPKQSGRWKDKLIPEDLTTDPGYAGRVEYPDQESRRYRGPFTLRITDVREEDSAEYRFTFNTENNFEWGQSLPGTILTVTEV
ncbi:hypothetical protein UPYG_G00060370 [Umbra pygmaea]|uniref:Ig-like domain-containing protein n=1 Tax=Umbra pygmaea TaxID=75934 RepID=A0ABD0X983_UMBPY